MSFASGARASFSFQVNTGSYETGRWVLVGHTSRASFDMRQDKFLTGILNTKQAVSQALVGGETEEGEDLAKACQNLPQEGGVSVRSKGA